MKRTLQHIFILPLMMVVMMLSTQNARAEQIDLNDVNAATEGIAGKWLADPVVLLKELPADVKKASCVVTFQKDSLFNITMLINGVAENIELEISFTIDGEWNYEAGGNLKVENPNVNIELTDIKIPDSMKEQLMLIGMTEESLKPMFNEMIKKKSNDIMNSDAINELKKFTILSLTDTEMVFASDEEDITLKKVME